MKFKTQNEVKTAILDAVFAIMDLNLEPEETRWRIKVQLRELRFLLAKMQQDSAEKRNAQKYAIKERRDNK